jgi:hypothetical protein
MGGRGTEGRKGKVREGGKKGEGMGWDGKEGKRSILQLKFYDFSAVFT